LPGGSNFFVLSPNPKRFFIKRKEKGTMAEKGYEGGNFLRGLLTGAILGALAGVLFAPKSGKELRDEIKQKGGEAFEEAKEFYSDARGKAKAIVDDARRRAEELRREADRQLSEARQRAREILAGEEKGEAVVEEESRQETKV
jgi:gas vesicle protein